MTWEEIFGRDANTELMVHEHEHEQLGAVLELYDDVRRAGAKRTQYSQQQ